MAMRVLLRACFLPTLLLALIAGVLGCQLLPQQAPQKVTLQSATLRLGHDLAANSFYDQQMQRFAQMVKEKTSGKIEIQVFAGGTLGKGPEMSEDVKAGTLDMQLSGTPHLQPLWAPIGVLDLPFVLNNWDQGLNIVEGAPGKQLSDGLVKATGIRSE